MKKETNFPHRTDEKAYESDKIQLLKPTHVDDDDWKCVREWKKNQFAFNNTQKLVKFSKQLT